ncbi:hypothetical protein Tco_1276890 [Tanacetum coccineum]
MKGMKPWFRRVNWGKQVGWGEQVSCGECVSQFDKDAEFILSPLLSNELQEFNFLRNMDFLTEGNDNEFDAILAEMEKEMNIAEILKELGCKCTSDTGLQNHKNAFLTFFSALCRRNLPDMPPGDEHS